jgi:hypothetical protein
MDLSPLASWRGLSDYLPSTMMRAAESGVKMSKEIRGLWITSGCCIVSGQQTTLTPGARARLC